MLSFRLSITITQRKELDRRLKAAQTLGDLRTIKFILAIFAVAHYQRTEQAALVLQLSVAQVERYVYLFMCYGAAGVGFKKSPGRPPKLTKEQKQELARMIDDGPAKCGFDGNCWRSPMVQQLILDKFGKTYSVFYIAELLKNLGFSFQKARFVSDHLDEAKRRQWRQKTWPQILKLAREKGALLLFGDEASFPQWGTLTYTWARKGSPPVVKTSGKRKGYKVFGLIDYFTGRFFHSCITGRLNSESYQQFLLKVMEQTTQHIVLLQDGARYHTSAATHEFFARHAERLTVFQLPSYSPDLNPIEKLWKKIKEQDTHLHHFPTFESLIEKVDSSLVKFANRPAEILALFGLDANGLPKA
jgi:transposase